MINQVDNRPKLRFRCNTCMKTREIDTFRKHRCNKDGTKEPSKTNPLPPVAISPNATGRTTLFDFFRPDPSIMEEYQDDIEDAQSHEDALEETQVDNRSINPFTNMEDQQVIDQCMSIASKEWPPFVREFQTESFEAVLIEFVVKNDISFESVTQNNNEMKRLIEFLSAGTGNVFQLPSRDQLPTWIITYGKYISFRLHSFLSGKKVTLMFDGATSWNYPLEAVLASCQGKAIPLALPTRVTFTASDIQDVLFQECSLLKAVDAYPFAAVADNAAVNPRAVKDLAAFGQSVFSKHLTDDDVIHIFDYAKKIFDDFEGYEERFVHYILEKAKVESIDEICSHDLTELNSIQEIIEYFRTALHESPCNIGPLIRGDDDSSRYSNFLEDLAGAILIVESAAEKYQQALRQTSEDSPNGGVPLWLSRCLCHILSLVLSDCVGASKKMARYIKQLSKLAIQLRTRSVQQKLQLPTKCPLLQVTKWHSIHAVITWMVLHSQQINDVMGIHFTHVKQFVTLIREVSETIKALESDDATIVDAISVLKKFKKKLVDEGSTITDKAVQCLDKRLSDTRMDGLLQLAGYLTELGRQDFNRKDEVESSNLRNQLRETVERLCLEMGREDLSNELAECLFIWLMNERKFPYHRIGKTEASKCAIAYWDDESNNQHHPMKYRQFCYFASLVVRIPASEAPAERIFSSVWRIHTPERKSLSPEVIEACTLIKYWIEHRAELFPREFE